LMLSEAKIHALRRLHLFQERDADTVLPRKSDSGRRRLSVRTERGGHRWSGHELVEVGLPFRDLGNARCQPAWRAVTFDGRIRKEPVGSEDGVEPVPDLTR